MALFYGARLVLGTPLTGSGARSPSRGWLWRRVSRSKTAIFSAGRFRSPGAVCDVNDRCRGGMCDPGIAITNASDGAW